MEAGREQVESWKQNPWHKLPTWAKWTIGIVGAICLLGIGGAIGSGEEDDLKSEVQTLESQLASAEQAQDEAASKAARLEGLRSEIIGEAKRESAAAKENLASIKDEVAAANSELSDVEGSLSGAEHEAALSTISDGIWKAETDYIPGTYRTAGGPGCYWATLNSADPYDIASNENGTGQQIATIESPYFQTEDCGTWERIE